MQWIGFLALGALIVFSRGRIRQVIALLGHVHWYVLILFIAVQLGSYWFTAKYYQSFFEIFKHKVPTKFLYIRSLVVNFVNQAFPSGGISGTSYLSNTLKDYVPPGQTTLAQLMNYLFTVVAFLVVLTAGFFMLFLTGRLEQASVRVILLFILIIVVFCIVMLVIISDRVRLEQFIRSLHASVNRFGKHVLRRKTPFVSEKQLDRFLEEFYQGYDAFTAEKGHWRRPFWYSLGYNITEVATVYVVFVAFGHWPNPGAVIAAYTLANIFSLVAVLTNGAGVYEATMIGTLVALGVPFNISFPVVLVYRVLNFALFLPPGYYYYRKTV